MTFEGIVGISYTGDIAIDSVKITDGKCPGKNLPYIEKGKIINFTRMFPILIRITSLLYVFIFKLRAKNGEEFYVTLHLALTTFSLTETTDLIDSSG